MNFWNLLSIEFIKVKRSKIIPLIFIAPLLVVSSGVASLHRYFTPEYTNAWAAMFIQSALIYSYYLLPLSMIVICVMIAGRETAHNGILKMLVLPVNRRALSAAKFCVLVLYLLLEIGVFFVVFVVAGLLATSGAHMSETVPIPYLVSWCVVLFLTMLPSCIVMWAITVLFEKPLLSIGLNILLVIPSILAANTPLWLAYPSCYSGYFVTRSLHAAVAMDSNTAAMGIGTGISLLPFITCAALISALVGWVAMSRFGKNHMR